MSASPTSIESAESRYPAIVTMLLAVGLVTSLPARYQVVPAWFPWAAFVAVVSPMAVLSVKPSSILWHRIERLIVLLFVASGFTAILFMLARLTKDMIAGKHDIGSVTLLESAAVIWAINILVFSLLYWQVDRAGPEARALNKDGKPDFIFGEKEVEELAAGWEPSFVDYLFLAFATSTSFTPPDYARPASRRAKLMVMAQATLSLTTLVLIASRAVATLT